MIYTPLTNKAMRIAYEAHHGQVDKYWRENMSKQKLF